jgi:hypothetical protein
MVNDLPPLVTDANGIAWYRAAGSSSAFTSLIEYADPGYFTESDPPRPHNPKGNTARA